MINEGLIRASVIEEVWGIVSLMLYYYIFHFVQQCQNLLIYQSESTYN